MNRQKIAIVLSLLPNKVCTLVGDTRIIDCLVPGIAKYVEEGLGFPDLGDKPLSLLWNM